MELAIIKKGNSRGLRLSKSILDRYNIKDKVELIFEQGQIILKPIDAPRDGWAKAFKDMRREGDDELLIEDVFEDENLDEWN
jgi:antitoxin MazE